MRLGLVAFACAGALAGPGRARAGEVEGLVRFTGPPPAPAAVPVTKDKAACGEEQRDEAVLVSDGRLANVVVVLHGPGLAAPPPGRVELGQRRCRFEPRVLVAPVGSTLEALNEDRVLHAVNGWLERRSRFDLVTPGAGSRASARLDRAGFLLVRCDVHAWMAAVVAVVDGPAALSGADGRFVIRGLPAGKFSLRAWHERLGERTAEVTVPAEGSARVELSFEARP